MRLAACSLLVLVACHPGGEGDDYYVEPGGGGGSFSTTIGDLLDAPGTGDGGADIEGRVCGLSEMLRWDECDAIGMDGLTIRLEAAESVSAADGAFQIPSPVGTTPVWRVLGNQQLASLRGFSGDYQIPSIPLALYQDTAADADVAIGNNVGTIFVKVIYMSAPVAGVTASLAGLQDLVRYDDANANGDFNVDMTHADGIIWFPNVTPGAAVTFTVTPPTAVGAPKAATVIVEPDTATFATVVFP